MPGTSFRDGPVLWRALMSQDVEIVHHGPDGGRRVLMVARTGGQLRREASLNLRERDVAYRIGCGASNLRVASELGVAERTVGQYLRSALQKLALSERLELATLMLTLKQADRMRPAQRGRGDIVAVSGPEPALPDVLSSAQREVVQGVIWAVGYHELARRRGVSVRTIANQLVQIHRKLGVTSRVALVAKLAPSVDWRIPAIPLPWP